MCFGGKSDAFGFQGFPERFVSGLACIVLTEDAIFALYACDGQFLLFTFLAVLLSCPALSCLALLHKCINRTWRAPSLLALSLLRQR